MVCLITREESFLLFRIFRETGSIPSIAAGIKELISDGIILTMTGLAMRHGETVLNW